MTITELGEQAPVWLKRANTVDANVAIVDRVVIWKGGIWKSGIWKGGIWKSGIWGSGIWESGIWEDGIWGSGIWKGGTWDGGIIRRTASSVPPLILAGLQWSVLAGESTLIIGCQEHTWEKWAAFTDEEIHAMHVEALPFWRQWKPVLLGLQRQKGTS